MQKNRFWILLITNILLVVLLLATIFQKKNIVNDSKYGIDVSLPSIVATLRPGVVGLFSQENDFYAREKQNDDGQSIEQKKQLHVGGSAFFIDTNGYLLTSKHVVENKDVYVAVLDDGSSWKIDKIRLHPSLDLAILHLANTGNKRFFVPSIKEELGTTLVGEESFALGTPFSQYTNTLSAGILSATGRILNLESGISYSDLYQLDMDINPGNSGGPLFNKEGKIFGVITAISSQSSHIGFALPISQKLISSLLIDIEDKPSINIPTTQ